ncbi:MAG TPA: TetR/AcrR family transcriptional regulator [Acidimicrobiales bacterium]|jgi:AcrR family transcriptional regulator
MARTTTADTPRRRAVTDAEKAARRVQILDAAKSVFATSGFHDTTVADVAGAAGLSYGSIYWYFDSKDALFHAVLETEAARLAEAVVEALDLEPTVEDPLRPFTEAVRVTLDHFEDDPDSARLLFRDAVALGGEFEAHVGRIYERFIRRTEDTLAQAAEAGGVRSVSLRLAAVSVSSLVMQLVSRRLVTDDGMTTDEAAAGLVDLCVNGLRPAR